MSLSAVTVISPDTASHQSPQVTRARQLVHVFAAAKSELKQSLEWSLVTVIYPYSYSTTDVWILQNPHLWDFLKLPRPVLMVVGCFGEFYFKTKAKYNSDTQII